MPPVTTLQPRPSQHEGFDPVHATITGPARSALEDERAVAVYLAERARRGLNLPLLPEVVQHVLVAASDERSDARTLAALVRRDPAVASHLLRVANSALYAPDAPIVSLQQALSRLGTCALRQILLVISCDAQAFRVRGREAEVRDEFKKALATAVIAHEIARTLRRSVDEAFLGGLLHDVGRPVVLQALVDAQAELRVKLAPESEARLIDELHAETGATLLTQWQLAPGLAEAVRHHHAPLEAPRERFGAALVCFADALASHALGKSDALTEDELRAHASLLTINLYPDDVEGVLSRLPALLAKAGAAL